MRVIIPIGGIGKRFKEEGYEYPKPLINVLGKPMIVQLIKSLKLTDKDEIFIIYNSCLKNYNFEDIINHNFPKINIKFHCLEIQTRGAAQTVLVGLDSLNELELNEKVLVLDCDTFYKEDILKIYSQSKNGNLIFYFTDNSNKSIFSYLKLDQTGKVLSIAEKIKISQNASTGAYGFNNGHILKKYCAEALNESGEPYISSVYKKMIEDDIEINSVKLKKANCVGTPIQLKVFSSENSKNFEKLRFCFDLDNTLVSYPVEQGDYNSVKPILKNIEYLKFLKNCGHHIIIYTARRMKTHNGNISAVISDIKDITVDTLEKFKIPYDELIFGKPYADFYIDDLAINSHSDLEKYVGIYNIHSKSRHFNEINFLEKSVIKKTNNEGECFWHNNVPDSIKNFFPTLYEIKNNKICMEKINGVTFSHLFINKLLTEDHVSLLLEYVHIIHTSTNSTVELDIYKNYHWKLQERYTKNIDLYKKYGLEDIFYRLKTLLSTYEDRKQGEKGVIHGDLVFTNVILTENGEMKFIDMRGIVGEQLTIFGDIYYDYAKIYQSLMGYDYILKNIEIDKHYQQILINCFEKNFSDICISNIKIITASLLFSLLPLHEEDTVKFLKYIEIINKLVY